MGSDTHDDDFEDEFGPLVRRLRKMKWPEVAADVRDRCWQDFQKLIGENGARRPGDRSASRDRSASGDT
jgi:hypothetical protein